MKRWVLLVLVLLLCMSAAHAENVIRMACRADMDGESYSGWYTGETENGLPQGFGIFEADAEAAWHYVGSWQQGAMNGTGGLYWNSGRAVLGNFLGGVLQSDPDQHYIGNKKSGVFHFPGCNAVSSMKETNRVLLENRDQAIAEGYRPCGMCEP